MNLERDNSDQIVHSNWGRQIVIPADSLRVTNNGGFVLVKKDIVKAFATLGLVAALLIVGSTPATAAPGTILKAWKDAKNQTVFVRSGTYSPSTLKGFGLAKIQQKHRINSINSLVFITSNPNGGVAQGSDRLYTAYANKKQCNRTICVVVQSVQVRAIMSNVYEGTYYGAVINGAIGIKTAYCVSDPAVNDCPSWIDQGLQRNAKVDDSGTVWSYEPLVAKTP